MEKARKHAERLKRWPECFDEHGNQTPEGTYTILLNESMEGTTR